MYIGDQNFDLFFASTMETIRLHIHNTRDECYFQNITGETYVYLMVGINFCRFLPEESCVSGDIFAFSLFVTLFEDLFKKNIAQSMSN